MKWVTTGTRHAVDSTPCWFGPASRPLFGWVHRPAAATTTVPAVVVVCPSLGQEAVFAHRTLQTTADELAAAGCLVVRVDYDGTGDSAGAGTDDDRVAAWQASIAHAIELGRAHADAPLLLLGFRLGALLATEVAAGRDDVDGLVLWDAPRTGRQFLREFAIRQSVSVAQGEPDVAPDTPGWTAMGLSLPQAAHDDLRRLDLRRHRPLPAGAALSIERPGVPGLAAGATDRAGRPVHRVAAADQDDLLARHAMPHASRRAVLDWVRDTFIPGRGRLRSAPEPQQWRLAAGGVRERVVSVGPNGLFGIVTEPDRPASATTVVFVPDSITPHSGLSRIWTEQARAHATAGIRSLRFDLGGCGDSPTRPGVPHQTPGLLAHLDDVLDAVRTASPADPADVVLVGLCSGAYLCLETALTIRPRGVATINPVLSFITPEPRPDPRRRAIVLTRPLPGRLLGRPSGRLAERLSHTHRTPAFTRDPNFAWGRALEACFWQVYLSDVAPWLPDRLWRVLNAVLTTNRLHRILGRVRAGGTRMLLLAGDPDFVRSTLGAAGRLRALARGGGLRVEHAAGLDHALMAPGDTDRAARSLTAFVHGVVDVPVPDIALEPQSVPQAVS